MLLQLMDIACCSKKVEIYTLSVRPGGQKKLWICCKIISRATLTKRFSLRRHVYIPVYVMSCLITPVLEKTFFWKNSGLNNP